MAYLIALLSMSVMLVLAFVILGICMAPKSRSPVPYFSAALLSFAAFALSLALFIGSSSRHTVSRPVPAMGPALSYLGIAQSYNLV